MCRLFFLLLAVAVGCTGGDDGRKETVSVTGTVLVDGKPARGVQLVFHPDAGVDLVQPTQTTAFAVGDGSFAASTYEIADGAPLGDYHITFTWPTLQKVSMSFVGDRLKGKYADLEKASHTVTVVSGQPVDLGRIELVRK